ncbi:MAG: elongation factor P [Candidatus Midichloria sp.]|nr:elongation factor P [Candidatus Midichloria sp.]
MKIDANSIRAGNVLEYRGKLWVVLKSMHTQPGKGGAYMQVEMKEMQARTKTNVRFRSSETVEKAYLDTNNLQYLYTEGNKVALMGMQTYEQVEVDLELIGDLAPFLKEGMNLVVQLYESKPVSVSLPEKVEGIIAECDPVIRGQTATSSYKPAVLENGVRIMVPPFINQGDKILVSTVTLEYLERA